MTGTFSSFNTALSALRYNRVAMDTASGNIANVSTQGYVRRRVEAESVGAPPVPALWSRYEGYGDGVRVSGITRLTDGFIDARQRTEHGNQSYLDTMKTVLDRVESGIGEPGSAGVARALDEFGAAWHDVASHPDSPAARDQLLGRSQGLVEAIRAQAGNLTTEAADQQVRLTATLAEVDTVASDLAATNAAIAVGRVNDGDVSTLLDQRDLLALRLAELTGGTAIEGSSGNLDVSVNGVPLVTGQVAARLQQNPGTPVSFSVLDPSGTATAVPGGFRGEVGAITDLLTTTLPGYLAQLDSFAVTLADRVNAQHVQGFDLAGNPGSPLLNFTPGAAAGSLAVSITDPDALAASGVPGGNADGSNAEAMAALDEARDAYQLLVGTFGTQVASVSRLTENQQVLTDQLDGSHDQLAGVNLDEEMVSMVAAQRAFEAASRVISTLDDMLDTLINRTGLVR